MGDVIDWLRHTIETYFGHAQHGNGYQWWSGAGSDIGEFTIVAGIGAIFKHHNCHHKGCWRPGHRHPQHGWPACKRHWQEDPHA